MSDRYHLVSGSNEFELIDDIGIDNQHCYLEKKNNRTGEVNQIQVNFYYITRSKYTANWLETEVSPEDGGGIIRVFANDRRTGIPAITEFAKIPIPNSYREYANLSGGIMFKLSDYSGNITEEFVYPFNIKCTIPMKKLQMIEIRLKPYDLFDILKGALPKEICTAIESIRQAKLIDDFSHEKLLFPHTHVIISNAPTAGSDRLRRILAQDIWTPFAVSPKLFLRSAEESYDTCKTIKSILIRRYHDNTGFTNLHR